MSSRLGAGLLLAAVLLLGAGAWRTSRQAAELESELHRRHAREQQLQQRLAEAQAEEDRRLDAIEAARRTHEEALQAAEHDRAETEAALSDREAAEQDRREAALAAERAHKVAAEADRRAREEREKREQEWSRFAAALGKVAPTERSGWELTADLGAGLNLERRSRLAGVLLANQGYWAVIEDGGNAARAEELRRYVTAAGAPPEVVHRTAGKRYRLTISDTILHDPPPPPEAPVVTAGGYQIQVASMRDRAEAERLAKELKAKRFPVELDDEGRQGWTRVLVGPLATRNEAERTEGRLRSGGYDTWLQQR